MFFPLIDIVSNIGYPSFWDLSKVSSVTLSPPTPLSSLRGWNGNFECGFSIKILRMRLMRACHILLMFLFFMRHETSDLNQKKLN